MGFLINSYAFGGIPQDYVAWYTMDNVSGSTLIDESANSFDGTINGSVAQVSGDIGQALNFPGASSGYVDIGNNFSFIANTGEFSITQRFNLDTLSSTASLIGNTPGRTASKGFRLSVLTSGEIRFDITRGNGDPATILAITTGAGVSTGTYYDLQVIGDGSGIEILLDGSIIHTQSYAEPFSVGSDTVSPNIGRTNDTSTTFAPTDGKIDQLRIYDRPLTSAESALITAE